MGTHKTASFQNQKKLHEEMDQLKYIINTYITLDVEEDIGVIKGKNKGNGILQIDFINDDALRMFGFTQDQFYTEVLAESATCQLVDNIETSQKDIKNLLKTKIPIRFKTKIKRRDEKIIWIVGSGNVVVDENTCIFTFQNLTNLQRKDRELINLQAITQNIESGILVCKLEEGYPIIYANEGFANILDYTYEELQAIAQKGCANLVVAEDWNYVKNEVACQLKNKKSFLVTFRIAKKNDEIIWIENRGVIVERKDQEDVIQCVVSDITHQKEKEEALMISEKRYNIIINYSGVTTFDYNMRTKKMTIHKSDALEFNLPVLIENAVETIVNSGVILPDHIEDFRELFKRIEEGESVVEAVIHGISANKERRVLKFHITNIFDSRGNPVLAVGFKKDITETVYLQREKEFADTLTSDKQFMFEANITKDEIVSYDKDWAKEMSVKNVDTISYSNFINTLCQTVIHPEYEDKVSYCLSKKHIMETFESGEQLISIIYQRAVGLKHLWFENKVNIIKDELSENISIRCYIKDISEKKKKEMAILEEQKFYKKMMSKATSVYIVNISKKHFVSGHETWCERFDIAKSDDYTKIMDILCNKIVYSADQIEVKNTFLCKAILKMHKRGKDKVSCPYRVLNNANEFIWVRCTMNLFEDPDTGDVTGYAYVENIDTEKKKEIELIYMAEHDALTDMYNKVYTEKYITDFLNYSSTHDIKHAFFIIDIDYFKSINDNFGHAFGDAILSQVSSKIATLFREKDILGRIGGDEFVVFMKNIQNEKSVIKKAEEICASLIDVFTRNGASYTISASVGIALYNKHGKTYKELYKHSDSALYVSKENGKNQYTIYSKNIHSPNSAVKEINSDNLVESKIFSHNISEHVFRILYKARDKKAGINSVLELVGKHYDVSRAYVFEDSKDGKNTSNTFEWHSENSIPQLDQLQNISYGELENYMDNFDANGLFHMVEIAKMSPVSQKRLESHNIKTMIQCLITYDGRIKGFVGFDECRYPRIFENKEISDLQSISNILGVFILETRSYEESVTHKNMAISIMNGLDSYAYVCDPKTHDVLFINNKTKTIAPDAQVGMKCYHTFWNNDIPCKMCPMNTLEGKNNNTSEMYNTNLDLWVKTSATQINWLDAKQVCLVNNIDITEYKKETYGKTPVNCVI